MLNFNTISYRNIGANKVLFFSAFVIIVLFLYAFLRDTATLISLDKTQKLLKEKRVSRAIVSDSFVYLESNATMYKIARSQIKPEMFSNVKIDIDSSTKNVLMLLYLILALSAGSLLYRYFQKRSKKNMQDGTISMQSSCASLDVGSTNESVYPVNSDIKFSDIGGIIDVKEELEEIIDFLRYPTKYQEFGARMPRGVLLVGPPGVGKTMIAKAVAGEANVPFFYQSGASFVQIYVGMGAKRVKELFSAAKNSRPAIIFIDEIDAVGKKRDGNRNDEREATLNQLLTEMDGFEDANGIIVIAATNKIDVLDEALLRAGRFDRRVHVDLPNPKERKLILEKYLEKIPNVIDSNEVAKITTGFNGASLAALVNEAALLSLRREDAEVSMGHINEVKERVLNGKKRVKILSQEQKRYQARYVATKAFVATWYDLEFEKISLSHEEIRPEIKEPMLMHEISSHVHLLLSGMIGCDIAFNEHASNALVDINKAKEIVRKMLQEYAMGEALVSSEDEYLSKLQECYSKTYSLVSLHENIIVSIEEKLIEDEYISKVQIQESIRDLL